MQSVVFRSLIAVVASLLILVAPARAQSPEIDASRSIIERQLDAFQRDSWPEAYDFAAPSIQQIFPTPEIFSQMVTGQYPMVWRPSAVDFIGHRELFDGAIVHVMEIVDGDGVVYIGEYFMRRIDGEWRVAGVQINRRPGASA